MLFDEPGPSDLPARRKIEPPTAYSRFKRNEWLDGLLRKLQDASDPPPSPPPSPIPDFEGADAGSIAVSIADPAHDHQSDEGDIDYSTEDLSRPTGQMDEIILDMSSDVEDEEEQEEQADSIKQPDQSYERTQIDDSERDHLADELESIEESSEHVEEEAAPSRSLEGAFHDQFIRCPSDLLNPKQMLGVLIPPHQFIHASHEYQSLSPPMSDR